MNHGILERWAIRETGRVSYLADAQRGARLVVYPKRLSYGDLIKGCKKNRRDRFLFLDYGVGADGGGRLIQFAWRLLLMMREALSIEFYLLSMSSDGKHALLTAALGKLLGVPVTIHDYGFRNGFEQKMRRRIDSIIHHRVGGDVTLVGEYEKIPSNISFRLENIDHDAYRLIRKSRSVPQVLVYGDFKNSQVVALARRAHDIIKQKYPRTEFILISFDAAEVDQSKHDWGDSFYLCHPDSEESLKNLFAQTDSLLLLSAGGLNRFLATRAVAANFPLITNGIDYPINSKAGSGRKESGAVITVVRDSYSRLAGEIVKLVDDENYYCGIYSR